MLSILFDNSKIIKRAPVTFLLAISVAFVLVSGLFLMILPSNVNAGTCQTGGSYGNDPDCPPDEDDVLNLECRAFSLTVSCRWDPKPVEEEDEQTLRVLKNGTGTGTVTSSPSGISCGSTCNQTSESRRQWDLNATPASGSTFTRWSIAQYTYNTTCLQPSGKSGCAEWATANTCGTLSQCRVNVGRDSSQTVTATFTRNSTYQLTTAVSPAGSGTISPSSRSYAPGSTASIFAYPSSGYEFSSWSGNGNCSNSMDVCSVTMNSNKTVTANFTSATPTITGSLTSDYEEREVGQVFTFEARLTSRPDPSNPARFDRPACTNGSLVPNSYTGLTDRFFQCTYSSPSSGIFDPRGASMRIRQGNAEVSVSDRVTVTSPDYYVSLAANRSDGEVNDTTFIFTPTAHNVPTGTYFGRVYSVAYENPTCGLGASPTNFSSSTGVFRCTYSSAGDKTARVTGRATRLFSPTLTSVGSVDVSVENAAIAPPPPADVSVTFTAQPDSIMATGSSRLEWNAQNATQCNPTTSNFVTGGSTNGEDRVYPTSDATYGILCTGPGDSASESVTVNVQQPAIDSINVEVDPAWVSRGGSTDVSWTIYPSGARTGATCEAEITEGSLGPLSPSLTSHDYQSGERLVTASDIEQASTFRVTCDNDADTEVSSTATVYILPSYSEF